MLGRRAFTDDLSKGIVSDDPDLSRGELLPKFVIGISKLCFVILGHGTRMVVAACRHVQVEI
jgi:hypothetical protein